MDTLFSCCNFYLDFLFISE